jgi:hypothetical protein
MMDSQAERIGHAAMRGALGAMAMTGMRQFTTAVGLVEEVPPRAILRQKSKGLFHLVPRKRRRAVVELAHWAYGAQGGAVFGLLPGGLRRAPLAGPAYGLATWVLFEAVLAPALGLSQAKKPRPVERAALAADHLLYGFVVSGVDSPRSR